MTVIDTKIGQGFIDSGHFATRPALCLAWLDSALERIEELHAEVSLKAGQSDAVARTNCDLLLKLESSEDRIAELTARVDRVNGERTLNHTHWKRAENRVKELEGHLVEGRSLVNAARLLGGGAIMASKLAEWADQSGEGADCERCGWPLADSPSKGCVQANCSQRPLPAQRGEPDRR